MEHQSLAYLAATLETLTPADDAERAYLLAIATALAYQVAVLVAEVAE